MVKNESEKAKKIVIKFINSQLTAINSIEDEFRIIKYLKHKEMERLIGAVREDKTPNSIRDITILLLILKAGFRKGSIIKAKWQDIDLIERDIFVNYWNKDNSYYVKLSDEIIMYLNELRKNTLSTGTYIFSGIKDKAISKSQLEKVLWHLSTYGNYPKEEFYEILRNTFIISCVENSEDLNTFFKLTGFSEKYQIKNYIRTFEYNHGFLTGFLD